MPSAHFHGCFLCFKFKHINHTFCRLLLLFQSTPSGYLQVLRLPALSGGRPGSGEGAEIRLHKITSAFIFGQNLCHQTAKNSTTYIIAIYSTGPPPPTPRGFAARHFNITSTRLSVEIDGRYSTFPFPGHFPRRGIPIPTQRKNGTRHLGIYSETPFNLQETRP